MRPDKSDLMENYEIESRTVRRSRVSRLLPRDARRSIRSDCNPSPISMQPATIFIDDPIRPFVRPFWFDLKGIGWQTRLRANKPTDKLNSRDARVPVRGGIRERRRCSNGYPPTTSVVRDTIPWCSFLFIPWCYPSVIYAVFFCVYHFPLFSVVSYSTAYLVGRHNLLITCDTWRLTKHEFLTSGMDSDLLPCIFVYFVFSVCYAKHPSITITWLTSSSNIHRTNWHD